MDKRVLITYASKYGATAEIAQKIGDGLQQAGLQVDVLAAKGLDDLSPYNAVILGSAVYMGFWRKEAVKFLKTHEQALAERAVWLFSSGPTGEGDPVEMMNGWRFPTGQQPIADRIRPRDIAVFHGYVNVDKLNLFEKWILNKVKAASGDFRDWDAIASWAGSIADDLKTPGKY
ncbi:MAG: flavodoxin domain-containing protein [Anaerolineae bacterium]|nr:flavodoxin domain-containing protein [Anaerolineae bacterium]